MLRTLGPRECAFVLISALTLAGCLRANPDFVPEDEERPGAPDAALGAPDVAPTRVPDAAALDLAASLADAVRPDLRRADVLAVADSVPTPDTGPTCATGEEFFGGRCYRVIEGSLMTYPEARQLCKAAGALPASIGSATEAAAIFAIVPKGLQAIWIGLLRTGDGKKAFVWESGEPLSYASWAPGEPNNSGYQEDCVVLWGPAISNPSLAGAWNDAACSTLRGAVVCERTP